jgi:enamine deaminase RidA (YjgF/YER057c/UK114 family)
VDRSVSDSPHELINPETLAPPRGYAHVVVAAGGRTVYLAGQTAHRADGSLPGDGLVEQIDQACANVVEALAAAGGRPEHLVSLTIYTTDLVTYRDERPRIGEAYRRHLGKHYPAMALLGVSELVDPAAKVEVVGVAVIPGRE